MNWNRAIFLFFKRRGMCPIPIRSHLRRPRLQSRNNLRMSNQLKTVFVVFLMPIGPSTLFAQRGEAGFQGRGGRQQALSSEQFDPYDFNGIWWRTGGTREYNTQKGSEPEFTPPDSIEVM